MKVQLVGTIILLTGYIYHDGVADLIIDHRKLHFTINQKLIAWVTPRIDNCSITHFQIKLMAVSGCEIEQVRGWSTNKTQFTVTSDHLFSDIGSLLYINISAFDGDRVCTFLGEMLRLDPSVVTEQLTATSQEETVCKNISGPGLGDSTVILSSSKGQDCICPLQFLQQDCYALESCPCSNSVLEPTSLVICSFESNSASDRICVTNITRNIHVHFVLPLLLPRCTGILASYRKYVKAVNIILAPELFEVTKTSFNYKETSSSLSTVTSNELAMNISSHLSQHGNIGSEEFYTESRDVVLTYVLAPSLALIFCAIVIITTLCIIISYSKMKKKNQESQSVQQPAITIELSPNECYSQIIIKRNKVSLVQNPAYQTVHLHRSTS